MNLHEFVSHKGSQAAAAQALNVTQGAIWQWLNGKVRITAERAMAIDEATKGLVSKQELRPDIYGAPEARV